MTGRDPQPAKSISPKTISVNQDSAISADEVRAELQKILADSVFANAEKMKRFLRFVVVETLEGRGEHLNEALVGMEVYSNGKAFDPRIDSTVRVEAGRLRAKLREFYESQGDGGGLRIEIPKGSYGPIFRRPKETKTNKSAQPSLKKSAQARTIAVLPFADMSPQKDQAYFGDGLAEELMFALSRMQSLRVVSQTSVFAFKGKGMDVREIGRQLGVESIMEGSVRKAEQQLRIAVRLTEVGTGFQIWSDVFERELKDVFEIQQQISQAVASALRIEVLGEREDLPRCSTTNLSAFNHFLIGRSQWNRQTEAALKAAIGHFEKALAEDPDYGKAHLGISDCLRKLEFWGLMRPSDALPKARGAAGKALAVDPTLIEANIPLAAIKATNEWEWAEAEGMFREVLKARPDAANAHQAYGMMCLLPLGRFDEHRYLVDPRSGAPDGHPCSGGHGLHHRHRHQLDERSRSGDPDRGLHDRDPADWEPVQRHDRTARGAVPALSGRLGRPYRSYQRYLGSKLPCGARAVATGRRSRVGVAQLHAVLGRHAQLGCGGPPGSSAAGAELGTGLGRV